MCIRDSHISVCRRNLDAYLLPLILVARPELELKRSGKGILAPVSYTHLDVYKRQVFTIVEVNVE